MHFFIWLFFLTLVFANMTFAATTQSTVQDPQKISAETQSTASISKSQDSATSDEKPIDASKHLVTAPDMNPDTVRDPFISFFDKKRQQKRLYAIEEQARRAGEEDVVDPSVTNYKMKHRIRPHDPLEEFDLGTLKLVAIMEMSQERIAMIETSTKIGFMVHVGEYMGTNNGRIIHITNDSIIILEEVLSPADELIVKEATLRLHPDGNDTY